MANRGIELGAGYVSLTVSTAGMGRELTREFGTVSKTADAEGKRAGGLFSRSFGAGTRQVAADAKQAAESAASAQVEANTKAKRSAADLEAAQAKATKAQQAYDQAVKKSGQDSADAAGAHAKLVKAQLDEADAAARSESANKTYRAAIKESAKASAEAERANGRYERSLAGVSDRAKAGITSPFRKLVAEADKDGRLSGSKLVQGVKTGTSRIGQAIGNNPFGRLVSEAGTAAKQASEKLHSGLKGSIGKIGGMLKGGLAGVGVGAATSIGGVLTAGFQRYTGIEDAQAKMTGLIKDTKLVESAMDSAMASVKGTSFSLGDASGVASTMIASGVQPGKDLDKTLKAVTGTAAAAGSSMGEMGAIFGKAAATGKIDGEILAQLSERQVDVYGYLSKQMGVSRGEIAKMASEGKISFTDFVSAMEQGTGDVAALMGQTTTGSIKNFGASIGRLGESVITAFAGEGGIAAFFGRLTAGVDGLESKIGPAVERIKAWLAPLTTGEFLGAEATGVEEDHPIIRVLFGIRDVATEVIGGLRAFGAAWTAMDGDITSSGFAGFMEQLAFNLRTGFEGIRTALENMWTVVGPILQQVWEAISIKWAELQPKVQEIFGTIQAAVSDAMTVIRRIIEIVTGVIQWIWANFGDQITFIVTNLMGALVRIFGGIFNVIGGIWKTLAGLLTGDWSKMGEGLRQITEGIRGGLTGIFQALLGPLVAAFQSIWSSLTSIWSNLSTALSNTAQGIWDRLTGLFWGLVDTLGGIFGDIVAGISRQWDQITDKVRTPIVAVIGVVWDGLGGAWDKVADLLGLAKFPAKPAGFARGGILPGYTPVSRGDDRIVPMRSGEGVSVSEAMRDPYERDRLHRLNRAALNGPGAMARFREQEANRWGGLAEGGLVWPVPSGWNLRYPSYAGHTGVDAAVPGGTPIRALRDGTVQSLNTYTTRQRYWGVTPGYGIDTVLNHGAFATRYSHQSRRAPLSVGQQVQAGQVIGYVGQTGKATGDHLHFEVLSGGRQVNPVPYLNGATQGDGGAVGSGFNPIQTFLDMLTAPFRGLRDQLAGTPVGEMVIGFGEKLRDSAIEKVRGVADGIGTAVTATGNRAIGMAMAAARGWIGPEWIALEKLWTKESDWNHLAKNPSSGAYGIPQSLPASKMASAGSDWRTNPRTQIRWGLDYIGGRYDRPSAAYAHSQRVNWYRKGTRHAKQGLAVVGEDGPELLQMAGGEKIRPMLRPHEIARQAMTVRAATAAPAPVNIEITGPVFGDPDEFAEAIVRRVNRSMVDANRTYAL